MWWIFRATKLDRPGSETVGTTGEAFAVTAPHRQEALFFVAAVATSAAWATYVRTLPGVHLRLLGAAIAGMLWACLYAGLGLAYQRVARHGNTARSLWRRLGFCLLLAVVSTHASRVLLAPAFAPAQWVEYDYLRCLLPVAFTGLWCAALLPRETRELLLAVRTKPGIALLQELGVLLFAAALLVSCADLAFQWLGGGAVDARLKSDVIPMNAWASNTLILFSAFTLLFAVTSRAATALLLLSPLYAAFVFANLAKIKYMHSAVQPLDLIRIPEFLPLFRNYFGTGVLAATACALVIWVGMLMTVYKLGPARLSLRCRFSIGLLSLAVVAGFPAAFLASNSVPPIGAVLHQLGAPVGQHREKARRSGIVLSFLSDLPSAFLTEPRNYSPTLVATTWNKYQSRDTTPPVRSRRGGVNLIIYLVESFMDPDDLGLRYTSDPIPNVRALRNAHSGGYAIVPERHGGSANTEFEVLTGMVRSFLPEASLPYRQYLRRPTPSLPRVLGSLGYTTVAVQADPKYYYNRERVYDLLGFQKVVWLHSAPGIERAERGSWPSDDAVVGAVIEASRGQRPFFVLAFPSSTHSPYNFGTYKESDLDVIDPLSGNGAAEVKEYINALRVADRAIGTLVRHLRDETDSTIIAVLGDHLPPLSESALRSYSASLARLPKAEQARRERRVPLLVWANFDLPREQPELSTNALPSYLVEKMGIRPSGLFAVSGVARRRLPVVSSYVQGTDGTMWSPDSLPPAERALVEDYRLLQYDLLLGEQYALRIARSGPTPSGGATTAESRSSAP